MTDDVNHSRRSLLLSQKSNALSEFEAMLETLMRTSHGRRAFLSSIPLLMAACASGEKSRYREGDNSGQDTSITVDDEKRMTQEALREMRKDYPALPDPELQAYVSGIGHRIVKANGLGGNPYTYNFTVVGVNQVNAFALPAGTIFVTAPLISMAESEAELAGVIGHEIGHVKARHAAERIEMAKRESSSNWLYAIGGGVLGGAAGFGIGKLICPPSDNDCMKRAAAIGAAAGVSGGLLVQKYKFMANSREDEMEADRVGFRTSVAAGYAPNHVGDFYSKLLSMEERRQSENVLVSSMADALSTHPPSRERVTQMESLAARAAKNPKAIVSTRDFDRFRKKAEGHIKNLPKS